MDAKHWNGDDTREFGSDQDEERCAVCGVGPEENCDPDCDCRHCERRRERAALDGPRGGEAAADARDAMADALKVKRG